MKHILIKAISLLLTVIMILSALSACAKAVEGEDESLSDSDYSSNSNQNSNNSNDSSDSDVGEGVYTPIVDESKFPENAFPIFDGSAYTVKVIVSDKATNTERQVATSLRSELKKKTKTTISQDTDFLKSGESYDPNAYEILVGKTNHTESASMQPITTITVSKPSAER